MKWEYRVFKNKNGEFGFIEVYSDDNGKIDSWSLDFMNPQGDTIRDLEDDLERMARALNKPTLEDKDLNK